MSFIGPFVVGEKARIALEVLDNGIPVEVGNPRVTRIIDPDGEDLDGFPLLMDKSPQKAIYYVDFVFEKVGPHLCVLNADYGSSAVSIEQIGEAMVTTRTSVGYPRIEAYDGQE